MTLPAQLEHRYCTATSADIRSWSFGRLTSPRRATATLSDNVRGTLHNQGIFGPLHDFRCACGKYAGDRYRNMICDICGVKVASTAVRTSRFGHIEFSAVIPHPFSPELELSCWPVLPLGVTESPGAQPLLELYDKLIEASATHSEVENRRAVLSIMDHLVPSTLTVVAWGIAAADSLAQGMALKRNRVSVCTVLTAGM